MSCSFEIEAIPEGQEVLASENAQAENLSASISQEYQVAPDSENTPVKQFSTSAPGMSDEMQGQLMQLAGPALAQYMNQPVTAAH